ncbi:MAG: tetratricopeptide repeat protein [Planctomycetota bacterium]
MRPNPRLLTLLAVAAISLTGLSSVAEDAPVHAYWPATAELAERALQRPADEVVDADEWACRAWALSRYRSDHAAAAEAAAKALTIDASHYKADEIAAICARIRGDYESAFEHYLKLIPTDRPESEFALAEMDALNLTRPQRDSLLRCLRSTLAEPSTNAAYRATLQRRLASMLIDRGELESAQEAAAALGPIKDWMIIGPFSNEENAGFGQAFGPETEIDYKKEYQGRDRKIRWQRLRHVDPMGAIDFDAVVYPNSNVLAYALTFVAVESDTDAVLRFGAGSAVKVWLNDQLILSNDRDVGFAPDQYVVSCRLRAGWNKLLFKVCERGDAWMMLARLTTPDGRLLNFRPGAGDNEDRGESLLIRSTAEADDHAVFDYIPGAYGHFQKLREKHTDNPAAAFYLALAETLTNRRMDAVATFERLVELNPRCSDHHRLLARAYLRDERPEKALVQMKKALDLEPNHLECLAELGRFYDRKGLFEKALATLRKAVTLNPDWPDTQYYLLELYERKDWEELVWRQAEWLLDRKPDVPWVIEAFADRCRLRGYWEQTRKFYGKALEGEYGNLSARQALISLAIDERRIEDALDQYDTLLKLAPLSVHYRLAKAQLLMEEDRLDEALAVCRSALDICEANSSVHKLIGKIHQRMGNDDQAMDALKVALKYDPDDKWIREYLEFLEPETIAAFDEYGIDAESASEIVQHRAKPEDYPKADAVRLLDHLVVEMNDDGSYTALQHRIVQILNDSGRRRFTSMRSGGFDAKIKRAVVIQPDGTEVEASRVGSGSVKFGQLQMGSIIELKSQYRGSANEWLSRHYTRTWQFQGAAPAVRSQFVLLVPKSRSINYAIQGDRAKLTQGAFEGHVVYDFRADNVPLIEPEDNRPPISDIADIVRVSTIEDWDEIARWEYSLVKDQFVADEAVRAKADDLVRGLTERGDKVRAIANFVMQKVQYRQDYDRPIMGMKPHKAGNVLEKEVGDCKDKATLLITMLRHAGIPANYTTLRTRAAGRLHRDIPSNQCNHAIIYVPDEGNFAEGRWIDATANYSGIDTLPWQNQNAEVLVFKDDGQLIFMNTPTDPPTHSFRRFDVDVQLAADGSAVVRFTWDAKGQNAARLRRALEAEGLRRQRLEQFANMIFPGSRVTSTEFSDLEDRDAPVKIAFSFDAPSVGQLSGGKMVLRPRELLQLTQSYADRTERTFPVWLPFTATEQYAERYHLPPGFQVETMPGSARLTTDWLDFEIEVAKEDGAVRIERRFAVKALDIPKSAYDDIREFCIQGDKLQREPLILIQSASPETGGE